MGHAAFRRSGCGGWIGGRAIPRARYLLSRGFRSAATRRVARVWFMAVNVHSCRRMARRRQGELREGAKLWGATTGIDARLREITDEVRALRQEMAEERKQRRVLFPTHPNPNDKPKQR